MPAPAATTTSASPPPVVAAIATSDTLDEPMFVPAVLPADLELDFKTRNYVREEKSGNYLAPKVARRTATDRLVPVRIAGKWVRDLKGQQVYLRESVRVRLLQADAAMFKAKQKHIVINYGFRSNAVQSELYRKIHGHGAVAPAGGSFHETGMALDVNNWREAQPFLIDAGFVGGCYGIEEDYVHYSIGEVSKASNMEVFKRCTWKELPKAIGQGAIKGGKAAGTGIKKGVGKVVGVFKK